MFDRLFTAEGVVLVNFTTASTLSIQDKPLLVLTRSPPLFSLLIRTLAKKKDFDSLCTLSFVLDTNNARLCARFVVLLKNGY